MLMIISPAKTLDYESSPVTQEFTTPVFLAESTELIKQLRTLNPSDIANLMGISDKLAGLNAARFEAWQTPFTPDNAKQAILAFKGDVYSGLDTESLSSEDFAFAQSRLRILSGLYGLLRPLDLMQAYRLEMGTRFANNRGKDLYAFWCDRITEKLNEALQQQTDNVLVNLASNEYFKSVKPAKFEGKIFTPIFKDFKNGQYKIISFYAKKARGLMVRYIIDNRINRVEELKGFDYKGYAFNADMSEGNDWVFIRNDV